MSTGHRAPLTLAGAALLSWYDRRQRDLPWRRRDDPWAIWVSEIMLQQTRAHTVCRYYDDFLSRFPDVESLAAASEEEVLGAWSGLGYYRRARNLHRAARLVAESGSWPSSSQEWRRLPGIGEYTAAAISSIVGGEATPVLDGNVERVVSRLLSSSGDPKRSAVRKRLRSAALETLDPQRPGDSNQALMELGATLCRPQAPRCDECPVLPWCSAATTGAPESYPPPRRRRATVRTSRLLFVADRGEKILLFRRSATAERLAGFWELPWAEGEGPGLEGGLAERYGGVWRVGDRVGRVEHSITHRRFRVEVYRADWRPDGPAEGSHTGWFSRKEIEGLATSSLVTKALGLPA